MKNRTNIQQVNILGVILARLPSSQVHAALDGAAHEVHHDGDLLALDKVLAIDVVKELDADLFDLVTDAKGLVRHLDRLNIHRVQARRAQPTKSQVKRRRCDERGVHERLGSFGFRVSVWRGR